MLLISAMHFLHFIFPLIFSHFWGGHSLNSPAKSALTNYAMFQIPLALLLSLESIGPLYSLPLALVMHKECPSFRASIGTMFAVTGIALLSLQES